MLNLARNPDRVRAAAGVAAFHALLGYALISGLAYQVTRQVSENLKVFDVVEPPPPPEEKPQPARAAPEPEGAAAPPSIKAIVAPKPEIRLPVPPPVRTAPASGNSDVVGTGTGSGGIGSGTGSGGSGAGTGGGGGVGAERIRGSLDYMDLPRAARQRRAQGTVGVRFTVEPSGRVTRCSVVGSSGDRVLDGTTCATIERRFRYRPARDSNGRPVAETVTTSFTWIPT